MLNKTYLKNIRREIGSTKSRFISFFGIVMLGVMMLTGLLSVAPDMRAAGDAYVQAQNMGDLRIVSTLGLTDEDIRAIAQTEGVKEVMPVYALDCEATDVRGNTVVLRFQGLPADMDATAAVDENINRLTLLEGRMPETPQECVVQAMGILSNPIQVGDTFTLADGVAGLAEASYTVVGIVQDPLYFSTDSQTSTAGDGLLDALFYVQPQVFTAGYYTMCYVTVQGADAYSTYSDAYDAVIDPVAQQLEQLSVGRCETRRNQLLDDANTQLADARQQYQDGMAEAEQQFAEAEQQINDARRQLESSRLQLEQGEEEYASGQQQLQQSKQELPAQLQAGADQIVVSEGSVLDFEDQVRQMRTAVGMLEIAYPVLEYAQQAIDHANETLAAQQPGTDTYNYVQATLVNAQNLYDRTAQQIATYQAQLDEGKRQMHEQGLLASAQLSNGEALAQAESALKQMKLALTEGQVSISLGVASAYSAIEQAEQQLQQARATLDDGWAQYQQGVQQLADAQAELSAQKAQVQRQLADARKQIADAEEQLDALASGEWYVLTRDEVVSFATFEQNIDRIEAIARIFPVFFFLVAALVASTTMTRMVEENRLQMGTLKALGYSEQDIAAKYIFYGLIASVLGSIAGILLGFTVIPSVIWFAYSVMYQLPTFRIIFYPSLILAGLLISALIIGVTTMAACRQSLGERTAALLLPRAPQAGKRIFLEKLGWLWQRMSFSQKTTARNLFRYKKRFFMTVLGVAGCTALLLVGFGIQDSIMNVVDKQFTELNHGDLTINLTSEKALTVESGVTSVLNANDRVQNWAAFYTRSVSIYNADGEEAAVSIYTAQSAEDMTRYFTFRNRLGHGEIPFEENSAILTEKTAELMGLAVGDTLWVQLSDGSRAELTLTGITENYCFSRLYLAQPVLESLLGGVPAWNTILAMTSCENSNEASVLSERILSCNYVSSTAFTSDTTSTFTNMISCINYVVLLIIVLAAALAAVVLYNLINVNLAERKKELATIKVLGFYDKEVYRYIFREIDLLSLIGAVVGIALGVPLHQFIIHTVEVDQMMFIRMIAPGSYLYAVVLTMVFNWVVCRFMRIQVRHISMVESMKAPE